MRKIEDSCTRYGSIAVVQFLAPYSDAISSSGGVNVGESNHTKAIIKKSVDEFFWKISMRPDYPKAA